MRVAAYLLFATAAAGLTAGGDAATFLAAAAAAAAAAWFARRGGGVDCFATLDPDRPDGRMIAEAVRQSARRVLETREPVRLRLAAFTRDARPELRFDVARDGDLILTCDGRRIALSLPGVWLADHPLPLKVPHGRCLTLLLEPRGGGRVRAAADAGRSLARGHYLALAALTAIACLSDAPRLLAASLGFAFHAYLLDQESERAPCDSHVQRQ